MSSNPYKINDILGVLPQTHSSWSDVASRGYSYPELVVPYAGALSQRRASNTLPRVTEFTRHGRRPDIIVWYPDKAEGAKYYYPFLTNKGSFLEALLAWNTVDLYECRPVQVTHITKSEYLADGSGYLSPVLRCHLLRITKASHLRVRLSYGNKAWITEVPAKRLVACGEAP